MLSTRLPLIIRRLALFSSTQITCPRSPIETRTWPSTGSAVSGTFAFSLRDFFSVSSCAPCRRRRRHLALLLRDTRRLDGNQAYMRSFSHVGPALALSAHLCHCRQSRCSVPARSFVLFAVLIRSFSFFHDVDSVGGSRLSISFRQRLVVAHPVAHADAQPRGRGDPAYVNGPCLRKHDLSTKEAEGTFEKISSAFLPGLRQRSGSAREPVASTCQNLGRQTKSSPQQRTYSRAGNPRE